MLCEDVAAAVRHLVVVAGMSSVRGGRAQVSLQGHRLGVAATADELATELMPELLLKFVVSHDTH